jgi:hypothetical protein
MINKYTIAYNSRASPQMSETDLLELLDNSDNSNNDLGIKGILLFNEGNFLQVLEGEERVVNNLYEKIARDDRHILLLNYLMNLSMK